MDRCGATYVRDAELNTGMKVPAPVLSSKCRGRLHGENHTGKRMCACFVCVCASLRKELFSQVSVPHCGVSK